MQLMKTAATASPSVSPATSALLRRAPLLAAPPAPHAAAALGASLARQPALGTVLHSYFATAAPSSMLSAEFDGLRPQAYSGAAEEPAVIHEVDWSANNANYVSMIGTLGQEPVVKDLASGSTVANLNIAVKNAQKLTEWYTVDAWGRWADAIRSRGLVKGQQVLVEGRLKTDEWTDRTTGAKRTAVRIVASQISLVRSWSGARGAQGRPQQQAQSDWSAAGAQPPPPGGEWGADDQTAGAFGAPPPPPQQQYGQASPEAAPPQGAALGGSAAKDAVWEAYFANPANFWDNRARKTNPKAPDFKNKTTNEALWLNGAPAWVRAELDALESGVQGLDDTPPF